MRLRRGLGCVVIIIGLGGFGFGLMKYVFTGFPFGGGAAVIAEGHLEATRIMVPFAIAFMVGVALVWSARRGAGKQPDEATNPKGE